MPSIKDAIKATEGMKEYVPSPALPVLTQMVSDRPKANPSIRCPLPPFNSDPDTLRQFETGYQMPQVRVIPLPASNGVPVPTRPPAGVGSSAASSSSSTTIVASNPAKSVVVSTPILAPVANFQTSVTMGKSFQLLSVSADVQCEVRIYGTSAAQSFDNGRATGDPVPPEITSNIVTCVTFDSTPFVWDWQNRNGANQDTPQTSTIYITVFNIDPDNATAVNVTVNFVPLET